MPTEDLMLRMRTKGAPQTKKDVDDVGDSVRGVGTHSKRSSKDVSIFTRALTIMTTRAGIAVVAIGALALIMPALLPSVLLLTAGLLALGAVFAPVFLIGIGVVQRFKDTVGIAGSAASELSDVMAAMKHAFAVAISPAAAIVMRGLANAMAMLVPIVESFRPVFTMFAKFASAALQAFAAGLAVLAPEIATLFGQSGQLLMPMVQLVLALSTAFLRAAIYGLPVAKQLLSWLIDFGWWLASAVDWMNRFAHSGQASSTVATVFGIVAIAAQWVASVAVSLAGIFYQLWVALQPVIQSLGVELLGALHGVDVSLKWVNAHMGPLIPILQALAPVILIVVRALVFAKIAFIALNLAVRALTLGTIALEVAAFWWLAALIAVVGGLIYAYQHSETFRNIVNAVVGALKSAALWAFNAGKAVTQWLGGAFQWVADKAQWLWDKLQPILSVMKKVAGFTPMGMAAKGVKAAAGLLGFADGGLITRGGAAIVGENGPEVAHLPMGTVVEPNGGFPGGRRPGNGPSGDVYEVHSTLVLQDGTVLGKSVERAARKKKSTR